MLRVQLQRLVLLLLFAAAVPLGLAAEPEQSSSIISRIPRQPIASHALAAVGYSKRLHALEIEFRRGGVYRYLDVPLSVYRALLAADSKARFYNSSIRGKYRSIYVRPRNE